MSFHSVNPQEDLLQPRKKDITTTKNFNNFQFLLI